MVKRLSNPNVIVSTTAPSTPSPNDVWIDSDEPLTVGATGGFVAQPEPPTDTTVLWYDTDETQPAITALMQDMLNTVYPVGSIYNNLASSVNPATLLKMPWSTWVAVQGKVIVGLDPAQTEFDVLGETGGTKSETLTVAQMPSHDHPTAWAVGFPNGTSAFAINDNGGDRIVVADNFGAGNGTLYGDLRSLINNEGGGGSHNNLQPYIVAYMWQRTA